MKKPETILDGYRFIQGQKYLFKLKNPNESVVRRISCDYNLSFPVARVLYSRGVEDDESIRNFLFSSYERDVPHSSLLKDAEVAVARILQAISKNEKILIFGDYDVDGITSVSLFLACLLPLGANINYFLPNRERDGYGLSSKIVRRAVQSGYKLLITVDNGITALKAAQEAYRLGVDLIITDHHRPHDILPKALAIVNPNQVDCTYPYKCLPGVGVVFKIVSLIYEKKKMDLPEKASELLMLGTVADVMPLLGENRFWVQYGLGRVNKERSYAINVLVQNSRTVKKRLNSLDIGFKIAPQINALGRLSDSRDAVRFLVSANREDVDRVGKILWEMNEARKQVERQIYYDVAGAIETKKIDLDRESVIFASSMKWPSGVIGLVAGRLMHNFGRPAFLFHINEDGILKGSCRSIRDFDIFDALKENKDLLISFGGHSFAAGLSLRWENLPKLKERLEQKIEKELTPYDLLQKISLDSELELTEINHKLLSDIERLEPFGNQNEQPTFLARNVTLLKKPRLLKDKHVKCFVFSEGVIKPVIFFDRPDLFSVLNELGERPFHIAGHVNANEWQGRMNIEFEGVDVSVSSE